MLQGADIQQASIQVIDDLKDLRPKFIQILDRIVSQYLEEGLGRPETALQAARIGLAPFTCDAVVRHILENTETEVRREHFVKGLPDEF